MARGSDKFRRWQKYSKTGRMGQKILVGSFWLEETRLERGVEIRPTPYPEWAGQGWEKGASC